jgi:hypothetical protein
MADLFDTSQVPDDAAHWDALAARVAAGAVRVSPGDSFTWFADSRAGWLAAGLLLAAALLSRTLPDDDASAGSVTSDWTEALAPVDDVGRALMVPNGPPAIGALLLRAQSGSLR